MAQPCTPSSALFSVGAQLNSGTVNTSLSSNHGCVVRCSAVVPPVGVARACILVIVSCSDLPHGTHSRARAGRGRTRCVTLCISMRLH